MTLRWIPSKSLWLFSAGALAAAALASAAAPSAKTADVTRAPIRLDQKQQQVVGLTYGAAERRTIDKVIRTVGRFEIDERTIGRSSSRSAATSRTSS